MRRGRESNEGTSGKSWVNGVVTTPTRPQHHFNTEAHTLGRRTSMHTEANRIHGRAVMKNIPEEPGDSGDLQQNADDRRSGQGQPQPQDEDRSTQAAGAGDEEAWAVKGQGGDAMQLRMQSRNMTTAVMIMMTTWENQRF